MIPVASRLYEAIAEVCPIDGVSVGVVGNPASVRIDYAAGATAQQQADAQTVVASFDWSASAAAIHESRQAKARASMFYDRAQTAQADVTDRVVIAFAQLVLERFNHTAQKFNELQTAIAQATNLANFQTRAAAVGTIGILTQQQLIDAIKAKIAATGE